MTSRIFHCLLMATAVLISCVTLGTKESAMASDWSPRASERLVKLPGDHLKRAVENDFQKSPLAVAINDAEERVVYKKKTLVDLKNALNQINDLDEEVRSDLEYELLAEKQAYLTLAREQQDLRKRKAKTRIKLYEKLLSKTTRSQRIMNSQKALLLDQQTQAQARFQSSIAKVDTNLLESSLTTQSRYAKEYASNLAAIENLVSAINDHPMNQSPTVNGHAVSQEDYIRNMIGQAHAELALLDQEQTVLGYMAKLVSLDALALSENLEAVSTGEDLVSIEENDNPVASTVNLFIMN